MVSTGVATRNSGKTERERIVEAEAILTRFTNGARVSELMEEFGLSHGTVSARIKSALALRIAPTADEYRETQNALLDESMTMLGQQLDQVDKLILLGMETKDVATVEKAMAQRLKVIEVRTRVSERRARLNGLDRPIQVSQTITVIPGGVDAEVARLTAQLGLAADAEPPDTPPAESADSPESPAEAQVTS